MHMFIIPFHAVDDKGWLECTILVSSKLGGCYLQICFSFMVLNFAMKYKSLSISTAAVHVGLNISRITPN